MQWQIVLVLLCATRHILTKSIQNTTSPDELLFESRFELLETKIAPLENESKLYKHLLHFFAVKSKAYISK